MNAHVLVYLVGRLVCGAFTGIGVGMIAWMITGAAKAGRP